MKKKLTISLIGLSLIGMTSCSTNHKCCIAGHSSQSGPIVQNPVQYVNPMYGTGRRLETTSGDNNLFPGAVAPFGMIQWSPDTETGLHKGGYYVGDKRISDFSLDHLSGTGCTYGEDFAMMPFLGSEPMSPPAARRAFAASSYSHTNEVAKPGYYSVILDSGIKTELTTTVRSGFGRFTYPAGKTATMMINAGSDINGSAASAISINPASCEISGWSIGGHFCRSHEVRTIYFCAVFDRPFAAYSTWSDHTLTKGATNGTGTVSGAFISFDTSESRLILAKVAISYVSVANARANMEAKARSPIFLQRILIKPSPQRATSGIHG